MHRVFDSVAIYSNNCHEVVKKVVCEIGLGEIVELVIAYEDVPQFKPHPAGMEMLLKHFSLSPEEILYVGDKDTDRQVAEACGVPFYFVQELV
jgi:phosphoglycolate phosphatase-like HAD superfamily hydrolase